MNKKLYLFFISTLLLLSNGVAISSHIPASFASKHPTNQEELIPPDFAPSGQYFDQTDIAFNISNPNTGSDTEIYRSLSPDSGYKLIKTQSWLEKSFIDRNLRPRTIYYYKLRAVNLEVVSEFSQPEAIETKSRNYKPKLIARAIDENTVELTFTDNSYNDLFYIIHSSGDYYQEVSLSDSGRAEVIIDDSVKPGTTYTYGVDVTTYGEGLPSFQNVTTATVTTPSIQLCGGTGFIEREVWTAITGTEISAIPLHAPPTRTSKLSSFETPAYYGNNYGSRIRGYICVPQTGAYTFWISGDDRSELWLSTDDTPVNKTKIAFITRHTAVRQWSRYTTQKSTKINLVAGQRYYIEALHKEANGNDHLAIGWQLPEGTFERPIPGSRLMPWNGKYINIASIEPEHLNSFPEKGTVEVNLYPNPTRYRDVKLSMSSERVRATNEIRIEIVSITGKTVYTNVINCDHQCSEIPIALEENTNAGLYLVHVFINKKRFVQKLLLE